MRVQLRVTSPAPAVSAEGTNTRVPCISKGKEAGAGGILSCTGAQGGERGADTSGPLAPQGPMLTARSQGLLLQRIVQIATRCVCMVTGMLFN